MKNIKHFALLVFASLSAQASNYSDCMAAAAQTVMRPHTARQVCARAGDGFNDCFAIGRNAYSHDEDAVRACAPATSAFNSCYEVAFGPINHDYRAVAVCALAQPGFIECFRDSRPANTVLEPPHHTVHKCVGSNNY